VLAGAKFFYLIFRGNAMSQLEKRGEKKKKKLNRLGRFDYVVERKNKEQKKNLNLN
jgi:hypothetical protein